MIGSYQDLDVWKRSIDLADAIYVLTCTFPSEEKFGLSSQMRRAAVSVASNIAEGSMRPTKDFNRFLEIARGSLAELETQLLITQRQNFISQQLYNDVSSDIVTIEKMLVNLRKSLQHKLTQTS